MTVPAPPGGHRRLLPYFPALDGFRAVAVVMVLLFHGGIAGARGGFLGVTAFFVLSGFLMGSVLLAERQENGRIDVSAFWVRRARRLVPAALVLIGLVVAYVGLAGDVADGVVGDGMASAMWSANWRFVLDEAGYAAVFAEPSPFQHMWSLAVEEQFYVALPIVAFLLLGRRGPARRARLVAVVGAGIVVSTVLAAGLHAPGSASARVYYGTDTRAAEPLVGVLLAVCFRPGRPCRSRRQRPALDVAGLAGLGGLAAMSAALTEQSDLLYRGGFLVAAVLSAGVVMAATEPRTLVARALALPPLVALGRISYGVYLYHWPVFLLFDEQRTGLSPGPLLAVRCSTTVALAVLSYFLVERPLRWGRLVPRVGALGWANATVGLLAALVLVTSPGPSGDAVLLASGPTEEAPPLPLPATTTTSPTLPGNSSATVPPSMPKPTRATTPKASTATVARSDPAALDAKPSPPPPPPPGPAPVKVAVVGDSMAHGLAAGMAAWAESRSDVIVYNLATSGCPLAWDGMRRRPNGADAPVAEACRWWSVSSTDRLQKFRAFDPDVVVVQDALNEALDRKLDEWPYYQSPGNFMFDGWLRGRYLEALARFGEGGAKVVMLDPVCADWGSMNASWHPWAHGEGDRRVAALDRVTEGLAGDGHLVAQLSGQLCPEGRFTQTVAGVAGARPDGYHVTNAAATALAGQWLGPLVLDAVRSDRMETTGAGTTGW